MKEFLSLVFKFKIKELMFSPTNNTIIQAFRYLFVGGFATVVDLGVGTILQLNSIGTPYLIATAIGFIFGLITNFILSKFLVFSKEDARVNLWLEFLSYALIGVVGLAATSVLMWAGTWSLARLFGNTSISLLKWSWVKNVGMPNWHYPIVRIIVAFIVLVWNFVARKYLLYKRSEK